MYVYAVEVERRNWSLVFAGLAFWGMDWFNEIWNGLVFHFTNYAPVWGAPGKTAFLLLIGLNIEICFMFAIAGVTFSKMLPADKKLKVLGIPNRLVFAITRFNLLRHRRAASECRRCTHLGLYLVERWRPLADLPDRLPALLPGLVLGIRYAHPAPESHHRGSILGFDLICLVLFAGILKLDLAQVYQLGSGVAISRSDSKIHPSLPSSITRTWTQVYPSLSTASPSSCTNVPCITAGYTGGESKLDPVRMSAP